MDDKKDITAESPPENKTDESPKAESTDILNKKDSKRELFTLSEEVKNKIFKRYNKKEGEATPEKEQPSSPEKEEEKSEASQKEQPSNSNKEKPDSKPESPNSPEEENPESEAGSEKDFKEQLIELIDSIETLQSDDAKKTLLDDIPKHAKFFASNQQKSQELASIKKDIQGLVNNLALDDTKSALDKIKQTEDLDDLNEVIDEWFGDKESNPFRKLLKAVDTSVNNTAEHFEREAKESEERQEFEMEKAIFSLQKLDERYNHYDEVQKLAEISEKEGVSMLNAHKIAMFDDHKSSSETKNGEIKELKKQLNSLKKELKERNEQLSKKIKTSPISDNPPIGALSSTGASGEGYANKSSGFGETSQRLKSRLQR